MAFNGSALAFYKEASGNSFSFSGDVVGWIPITVANKMSPLNPDTFFQGSGSGIDTSGYDIITFIAAGSICGTSPTCGLATLGKDTLNGQPMGFIWLMGDVAQYADSYSSHPFTWTKFDYLLAHELGHVLSLYHAEATINCLGIFDACGTQGYGNVYDIMGQPQNAVHFNAHAREKLGWSNAPTQIAASGRYTLGSLQFGDSARFSANSREFLIEFRESIGFDSSLPPGVLLVNNLTQLGFSPALVDLAPSSPEFFLSPGDRISDSGVEISFISISSGQAIFDITLPGSPPTSSPQPQPTSTFTPATPTPTPNPSNASGTIRGYYSPNPLGDGRKGIVLDYTTTNIANTSPPSDGATIERNAAEIATIAESNLDLPAGTKIDFDPPSGTHTYTLLHWPSRDELARVRVTVPSSSPQPTSTFTPTPTLTPTPTPTSTPTQTQTPTPVPTATAIPTPAPQPGSAITQCDDDQNTCLTVQYWPVGSGGCHTELEPCVVFNHQIDEGDILGGYNNGGAIIRMDQADIFLLQPSDNDLPAGTRIQSPAPSSGFYSYMLHDAGQGNTAQQNSLLPRPIRLQIP
ncbi:MAG: hypothetical protein A2651_03930 [Candidatus Yanofskybacteria bacterium RIFCSPHIGHO2_01_FULL_42_12]|nr:MAG: hypothetical protein A2651_03930 [Candidatus Yanofskybacteria bacterium RIFCSPHIGHO2_01_FULL_42_12]